MDPAALGPALHAELGQLHALRPLAQGPWKRRAIEEVADEQLPLGLERIVIEVVVGYLRPSRVEIDRLRNVRVPHRLRRVHSSLGPAFGEAGYGRSMRAVDLEHQEVVATHPRAPGAVELRDDAAGELEGGIGGVIGIRPVGLALLVPTLGNVHDTPAAHRLDGAEEIVQHVAPMAEHVDDDAAALLLAVVPGRPLRRLPIALEHPIAEVALDREDAAEEAAVDHLPAPH